MDRTTKFRFWWRHANMVTRLIVINVVLSVFVFLLRLIFGSPEIYDFLGLHPSAYELANSPWGLFTYMWVHNGSWHLFSNMLFLYWLGHIFLRYKSGASLLWLYILGGLCGGILYIAAYQILLPLGFPISSFPLVGASAAVMAVVFGISFYAYWEVARIWGFGRVKLTRLAIAILILDFLLLGAGHGNYGGHLAHIGGAGIGLVYALLLRFRKVDITSPFASMGQLWTRGRISRKKTKRPTDSTRPSAHGTSQSDGSVTQTEIDRILDKIRQGGYDSLSSLEKRRLFEAGKK